MSDNKLPVPYSKKSNEQLGAIIVAYKLLGIEKDSAKLAMSELMKRKEQGSEFDYNSYIQRELDKSPKMSPIGDIASKKVIKSQIQTVFEQELGNIIGKRSSK